MIDNVSSYPNNNCRAAFGTGAIQDPQENFQSYLTHQGVVNLVQPYLNSTMIAQQANKRFMMFETNSASCGGFPGISDSFGGALWGLDYGLQMAYANFSNALVHIGGQNVYYNPFTGKSLIFVVQRVFSDQPSLLFQAPPTNQSTFHQWTVGAIYYSVLVLAEALGKSNTSQVVDLTLIGSEFTPAYAIYENGMMSKVALFNYVDDLEGTREPSDLKVSLVIPAGIIGAGGNVKVKYLEAKSVSNKNGITWAGQVCLFLFCSPYKA